MKRHSAIDRCLPGYVCPPQCALIGSSLRSKQSRCLCQPMQVYRSAGVQGKGQHYSWCCLPDRLAFHFPWLVQTLRDSAFRLTRELGFCMPSAVPRHRLMRRTVSAAPASQHPGHNLLSALLVQSVTLISVHRLWTSLVCENCSLAAVSTPVHWSCGCARARFVLCGPDARAVDARLVIACVGSAKGHRAEASRCLHP